MAAFGTALVAGLLATTTAGAAPATAPTAPEVPDLPAIVQSKAGSYVVILADAPSASYDGSVQGYAATTPAPGKSFDAHTKNVERWEARLATKQADVAAKYDVTIKKQFATALNGFSAELTGEQVAQLQKDPAVRAITPNEQFSLDYSSVDEVGLASGQSYDELAAGWTGFGGVDGAGKGVVVGIIDSGIAPQNPYFDGYEPTVLKRNAQPVIGEPYLTRAGNIAMLKADGTTFIGECEFARNNDIRTSKQSWSGKECNSKVLGARFFADDFLANTTPADRSPAETISPYDVVGHGSHTASTAAGNLIDSQVVGGMEFGAGSGMAPAAKIAAYKVCWEDTDPATGGCYTSAIVDAIDAAVSDGVDVLNFSISGSNTTILDAVSVAFYGAAAAGVFVSASAGNDGPDANTVAHGAPWMTTVAAASFSNDLTGTVELSDGSKYRGASVIQEETVSDTAIVLAEDVALLDTLGYPVVNANLCYLGTIDGTKAADTIVVCDRGGNARVEKSAVVAAAGGVGMVLVNITSNTTDADFHSVPSVHVDTTEGSLDLRAAVAADGLTASLVPGDTTGKDPIPQPQIAGFSSRGPHNAAGGDLLKPDVTAPGVGVLAAVSPVGYGGEIFGFLSGTSMASPHVAGFGALLLGAHPNWTPDFVKSALMTTSTDIFTADGSIDEDNLATGAGYANPTVANRPGLVFANTPTQWLGLVQTLDERYDFGLPDVPASQVNVASIALGSFTGTETVTRTVTALEPGTYNVTADVPGVDVTVTPSRFSIGRQQSQTLTFTFSLSDAPYGEWTQGDVTIAGVARGARPAFNAHLPVSIDVAEAAVSSNYVTGAGASGSATIDVINGRTDALTTEIQGLTLGQSVTAALVPGGAPAIANNASNRYLVTEMDGTEEFAYFEIDAVDDTADFDLYVVHYDIDPVTGALLGVKQYDSATGSADESLLFAAGDFGAGDLFVAISNAFTLGELEDGTMTLGAWGVGPDAGNLTVGPATITAGLGESTEVSLDWSGLTPGAWLGRVLFGETQTVSTLVKVTVE